MELKNENNQNLEEKVQLHEVATACSKTDGFGIIIEVHSDDYGIIGDETNPAHAHIKTTDGEYLGKFSITIQPPKNIENIIDCDKNAIIPTKYKQIIIKWSQSKNEYGGLEWSFLKFCWRALHPD